MDKKRFSAVFDITPPGAGDPLVREARLSQKNRSLVLQLYDETGTLTAQWVDGVKAQLLQLFDLVSVDINLERAAAPRHSTAAHTRVKAENPGKDAMIFGKAFSGKPTPMGDVVFAESRVVVRGWVTDMDSRDTRDNKKYYLRFDLGDVTGAVRVSGMFPVEQIRVCDQIEKVLKSGDLLEVSGKMELNTFRDETEWLLRPSAIRHIPRAARTDTSEHKRVELHLHTQMSQKDATTPVGDAIRLAAAWGHKAIAITDHGVCHAFPDTIRAAKETGVKILYGVEGYMPSEGKRNNHIILIAKNDTGLRNLYRLVSESHTKTFKRRPLIPRETLIARREGLIVGSACEAGELFRAIVAGRPREELLECARFYDYLEIQPICNNKFLVRDGLARDDEHLRDFNRTVVSLGEELGIPVCATGDVHFLEPEHEIYRRVLMAGTSMLSADPLPLYFRTTDEMLSEFSYLGSEKALEVVVTNPNAVADSAEKIKPVRDGEFSPEIKGSAKLLTKLCYDKAHALFGAELPELLKTRIETELGSITKKGYDVIYIIAQKIVQRSLEQGYYVGSRGSVGSSIVAFLAGITEVNALPPHYLCTRSGCGFWEFPDEDARAGALCGVDMPDKLCPKCGKPLTKDGFDLNFATFLGFFADKKPDIDLNFSDEYQERAHAHTVEIFGESQVFRAGTVNTLQANNARGYAKKYIESQGLPCDNPAEVSRLAQGCIGVKDTTGQHPGGLVIVPRGLDINDFCPVHYPANDSEKMITTHFDYHSIEENLLKLDLLGHKDPTMIRALEHMTGISAMDVPLDDKETISLFRSSKALGFEDDPILGPTGAVAVPEFGTQFVRGMLLATKPTCFEELLRISGLSHGTDVWMGNQEELVRKGVATLRQIICSRDDIMLYLISLGIDNKTAFNIMESVRKGKGLTQEWELEMRRAAVPEWYIKSCKKIQYMFPKSHAVAYVMMAFRVAWFKVHRPLAFYRAYFTKRAKHFEAPLMTEGIEQVKRRIKNDRAVKDDGDKDKNKRKEQLVTLEVVYEFYLRGFTFNQVSLQHSHATDFLEIDEKTLLPPFTALPGLGEAAAESIQAEREKSFFLSIEDIQNRTKANKAHIDSLREVGALSGLPESAQISLFAL
ncbi:MAG: PolC-type DNA polymerase III [Oscillospiraceae bacterium]|jgi:DNA polymerase-3 subunit alpha (Gram-positive type)|nr:PolC-type DNA polymerase III [Oscillospiraceae bacterium]